MIKVFIPSGHVRNESKKYAEQTNRSAMLFCNVSNLDLSSGAISEISYFAEYMATDLVWNNGA